MKRNKRKTFIIITLIILIPLSLLFVPVTPENAVRVKLVSTGYISSAILADICLTQDISPEQHCTYFCNGYMKGSRHGYRVKKNSWSFWYVAEVV